MSTDTIHTPAASSSQLAGRPIIEVIHWHPIQPGGPLPDDDTTVLLEVLDSDGEPCEVWPAWRDGDSWIDAGSAMPITRPVAAWAQMPVGSRAGR